MRMGIYSSRKIDTCLDAVQIIMLDFITQHRSIRRYKNDPVPENVLNEILAAGIRASSSGNMQSYSIIITRDAALRQRLFKPHMQQRMVTEAPVLLTFCADFNRVRQWLAINAASDGFDNFMSFMVAAIDATLVSQNVALAAEARGLGICYMGSTLANAEQIGDILELPTAVFPIVGFSLGYPDESPNLRDRLPLDGLIHEETYQQYSDERIAEIYHNRETVGWKRYMSAPRLRKLIEESNVQNLAQVYSEVKYTRESHQKISRSILAYLEQQGFMNNQDLK